MEAIIAAVMESWPLQLAVTTGGRTEQVALDAAARVTHAGRPVDPGALRPGQRVRIVLRAPGRGGRVAVSVEILD
jgi:hypothetical protein